jgi:hypothetical protein
MIFCDIQVEILLKGPFNSGQAILVLALVGAAVADNLPRVGYAPVPAYQVQETRPSVGYFPVQAYQV